MAQQRKAVTGGEMRTPVIFYAVKPSDDFFPGESVSEVHYQCFADVYPPSSKDLDMTDNKATITMVTYYPGEKKLLMICILRLIYQDTKVKSSTL